MNTVDFPVITSAKAQLAAVPWDEPVTRLDPAVCTYCARLGDRTPLVGLTTTKHLWEGMPDGWLATRCQDHQWNQGDGAPDEITGGWDLTNGVCPVCFTVRSNNGTCKCV
jgi:hypothetical protein